MLYYYIHISPMCMTYYDRHIWEKDNPLCSQHNITALMKQKIVVCAPPPGPPIKIVFYPKRMEGSCSRKGDKKYRLKSF